MLAAGAAIIGILAATALTGDQLAPAEQVTRDATGMAGLLALGAATLGASRAWIAPLTWTLLAWTLVARLGQPPGAADYQRVLTWMIQPAESTSAALTAVALGVTGILTYAIRGPRP